MSKTSTSTAPAARKAPDIIVKRAPSCRQCCNCGKELGTKVHPVSTTEAGGNDPEVWCPACFVEKRAPMEPGRWRAIAALACKTCGRETLATGVGRRQRCANCGSSETVPARPQKAA